MNQSEKDTYPAKKKSSILLRYYEDYEVPSVSTILNIIKRQNFFFRADTKSFRKRSKKNKEGRARENHGEFREQDNHRERQWKIKVVHAPKRQIYGKRLILMMKNLIFRRYINWTRFGVQHMGLNIAKEYWIWINRSDTKKTMIHLNIAKDVRKKTLSGSIENRQSPKRNRLKLCCFDAQNALSLHPVQLIQMNKIFFFFFSFLLHFFTPLYEV